MRATRPGRVFSRLKNVQKEPERFWVGVKVSIAASKIREPETLNEAFGKDHESPKLPAKAQEVLPDHRYSARCFGCSSFRDACSKSE